MMIARLLDYAFKSIRRRFWQKSVVVLIFSLLIFLLISVFSIAGSLRRDILANLDALPDIFVQKMQAGRQVDIPTDRAFEIATIEGVLDIHPRVWGYYELPSAQVLLTVIGTDPDLPGYLDEFDKSIASIPFGDENRDFFIAGQAAYEILSEFGYDETLNLYSQQGIQIPLSFAGRFKPSTGLTTSDVILIPEDRARELFRTHPRYSTDIVLHVPNPEERDIVKQKIQFLFPDTRIVSKDDLAAAYEHIFNYRTGLFLALLITSFMAFFTLVVDKGSGITLDERREIGIMKAVGWSINHVLIIKLFESLYIVLLSYLLGLLSAYIYVFEMGAPLLRGLFTGASALKPTLAMTPYIDIQLLVLSFLAIVPLYVFASIIPSWKASIIDADEVMR